MRRTWSISIFCCSELGSKILAIPSAGTEPPKGGGFLRLSAGRLHVVGLVHIRSSNQPYELMVTSTRKWFGPASVHRASRCRSLRSRTASAPQPGHIDDRWRGRRRGELIGRRLPRQAARLLPAQLLPKISRGRRTERHVYLPLELRRALFKAGIHALRAVLVFIAAVPAIDVVMLDGIAEQSWRTVQRLHGLLE